MGVIALAFFDPRSSRGPQRLLESAIWKKCLFSTGAQTVWNFDFCCFSDPHYFLILRGVNFILLFDPRSSRGTYWVKWWKWGVSRQMNIGLQIFSDLQKKKILLPHINSKERYLGSFLNFCPELTFYTVFKKSFKFQSQNLGIQLWTPQFSKFQNFL